MIEKTLTPTDVKILGWIISYIFLIILILELISQIFNGEKEDPNKKETHKKKKKTKRSLTTKQLTKRKSLQIQKIKQLQKLITLQPLSKRKSMKEEIRILGVDNVDDFFKKPAKDENPTLPSSTKINTNKLIKIKSMFQEHLQKENLKKPEKPTFESLLKKTYYNKKQKEEISKQIIESAKKMKNNSKQLETQQETAQKGKLEKSPETPKRDIFLWPILKKKEDYKYDKYRKSNFHEHVKEFRKQIEKNSNDKKKNAQMNKNVFAKYQNTNIFK